MSFSVRSISVGEVEVPGPELFWMSEWDSWFPLELQVVLIQGDGVTALVNTGTPEDLSPINDVWTTILGPRAELRRTDDQKIENALAAAGVKPSDVTHVFLTPFQLYSTANVQLFENARICMSKAGWLHFHSTHEHPHDGRWSSFTEETLVHLVTEAWDRVMLLDKEDSVAEGIRTWASGVHHRASMVVEVDTPNGVVAISDSFFYYENVEEGRLLGINENMYEALETNKRVLETSDHIVPLYDPKVFERYPGGAIE